MKMKYLIVVIASALISSVALGGLVQPAPVTVDVDNGVAFGDMATARFSDNDVEFIGCGVRYIDSGGGGIFTFGFCQASDSAGVFLFCSTEDTGMIEAIKSISDYSFITFGLNADGICSRIGNSTQSFYIPEGAGPDSDDDSDSDSDSDSDE